MANIFNRRLREYAAAEIARPGEHSRRDIAADFIADNPELVEAVALNLAEKQVDQIIRELCDQDADAAESTLFDGLPNAVVIEPGVVKHVENCDLDDLRRGEEQHRENIRRARERLTRYVDAVERFAAVRAHDEETVGEAARRLGRGAA